MLGGKGALELEDGGPGANDQEEPGELLLLLLLPCCPTGYIFYKNI